MKKTICQKCKKEVNEIDLWDKDKKLCDKCSMQINSRLNNNNNKINLSYIN